MVSLLAAATLRIGLVDDAPSVAFGVASASVLRGAEGLEIPLAPLDRWVAEKEGDHLKARAPGGSWVTLTPPARLEGPVYVSHHWYRGDLELTATASGVTAINELPLEDYLLGVVPAEMPASWTLEALKAQAVAARTYAVAHRGDFASLGYDLKATVQSQAYGGLEVEATASSLAVAVTRDQILTYQGKPINAYYCDAAGGYTEAAASVQGFERKTPGGGLGGYPYLQPVPDFDWASPRWKWEKSLTRDRIREALQAVGVDVGPIRRIQIVERSFSGRARWIRLEGDSKRREVGGQQFRLALGLNSTLFDLAPTEDGRFYFVGRGWGHGVGLSQWGARQLAEWGYTFEDILDHYYRGAELGFTR